MARIQVNPTRMELLRLKKRLAVARRGHKLLKDKRDELMKRFLDLVRSNRDLREEVETRLAEAFREFVLARAVLSREALESALLMGAPPLDLPVDTQNIMSVEVPVFELLFAEYRADELPYGMAGTPGELDAAIATFREILPAMLRLAEMEKTAQLLAEEIEKTRRRVNSLEYVLIPRLAETIRFITMKLDENERGNTTRLMKVKDMMVKQALEQARKFDESVATERAGHQA